MPPGACNRCLPKNARRAAHPADARVACRRPGFTVDHGRQQEHIGHTFGAPQCALPFLPEHAFAPFVGLLRQHRHEVGALAVDRLFDALGPVVAAAQLSLVEPHVGGAEVEQLVGQRSRRSGVFAGVADEHRRVETTRRRGRGAGRHGARPHALPALDEFVNEGGRVGVEEHRFRAVT